MVTIMVKYRKQIDLKYSVFDTTKLTFTQYQNSAICELSSFQTVISFLKLTYLGDWWHSILYTFG